MRAGEPTTTPESPLQTLRQLEEGAHRLGQARTVCSLRLAGATWPQIEAATGVDHVTAWRMYRKAKRLGFEGMTAEAFARVRPGPQRKQVFTEPERASLRALALLTNRNWKSGSAPEAVRIAAKKGELRPEIARALAEREASGKPLLTPAMRRELHVGEAVVRAFRNPREAWLEYVHSPGSLAFRIDPETGEQRPLEPGEAWTIDDGTINLVCNVPTTDPRWQHKVMPGRFQFLLVVDHRSYYVPGFSYTARPRGSYRAEDLLATLHIAMCEHGSPKRLILEKGVSASDAITRCCRLANIEIERASSPHQKMVELVFGCLWTKLSVLPGQVGRYQGEEAEVTATLERCRRGAADPRLHFPMLAEVLAALREAIADWNNHHVNGSRYGRWQPSEWWARESGRHLRPLAESDAWMFAPVATEPLKVRSGMIATSVLLAPGVSQQYTFSADWLVEWIGARVRLHFNPFDDESQAKAVLAEPFAGQPADLVLGDLEMVDCQARYTRRAWGYSDAPDTGLLAVRRSAQALHRAAQAIRPDGKPGVTRVDVRDGLSRVESGECRVEGGAARNTAHAPRVTLDTARWVDPRLADFQEEDTAEALDLGRQRSTSNRQPSTPDMEREHAQVE